MIANMFRVVFLYAYFFAILIVFNACVHNGRRQPVEKEDEIDSATVESQDILPDTVVDSRYTFAQAVAGSKAPQNIIDQLELINVIYLSTDEKIHHGQVLANKKITSDLRYMFNFMLEKGFVVEKAIPIVKYNWSDSLSMDDNNTSSFCYRNISYSKHAQGMAIDINPRFNPVRWKYLNKPNQPAGAVLDTTVNGTFYPGHFVVGEFRRRGFRWGHTFSKYYDDHHFEKR